jgi:hypothetical protein
MEHSGDKAFQLIRSSRFRNGCLRGPAARGSAHGHKYQLTRNHVRLQNQLESLLEECHIKLSSLVSDLFGASARRVLKALADGKTDPLALAALADQHLRARRQHSWWTRWVRVPS